MIDFLKRFFKGKKTREQNQFFFGLNLKENEGIGLIIELDYKNKIYKKVAEKEFQYSNSWENILEDVDQVLYDLEKQHNNNLKQVIFFLCSHLIDQKNNQVKKPYLKIIKNISEELGLSANGFIEYHEAIAGFLKHKEDSSPTVVIIELDQAAISIFVYKAGDLVFSDSTGKTETITQDIESIFSKIKDDVILPSRIILVNSSHIQEDKNQLASHRWAEDLFIQIPRVELFDQNQLTDALLYAFSSQFFNDEKVEVVEPTATSVVDFGFVVGGDVNTNQLSLSSKKTYNITQLFENLIEKVRMFPKPRGSIIPIAFGLVTIIIVSICVLFFSHKASVTLLFKPHEEEKELAINQDKLKLLKQQKSIELTESQSTTGKKTIGHKASGAIMVYNKDSAERTLKKGSILSTSSGIGYILDSDIKVASASESLTGEGNVLTVTGKVKASATAQELGPKGNINKGEKLSIEGLSSNVYFAISDSSFTGGTADEVSTISKDDLAKIKQTIAQKMKSEKNTLLADKQEGDRIVDSLSTVEISNEKYSGELGEEAKTLKLQAKGVVTYYSFKDVDLKKIILEEYTKITPSNYQLSINNISFSIQKAVKVDNSISLTVLTRGRFMGKVDEKSFKRKIRGTTIANLEEVAKEVSADGFKAKIDSPGSLIKSRLPFFTSNIDLYIRPL